MFQALLLVAVSFLSSPVVAQGAGVEYFERGTTYAQFERFLGEAGTYRRTYQGKTPEGKPCQVDISKDEEKIFFSPGIPGGELGPGNREVDRDRIAFVVRRSETFETLGRYEGTELWASYFLDNPGEVVVHGQFGTSFRLQLKKSPAGALEEVTFSKAEVSDLVERSLGHLTCQDLK